MKNYEVKITVGYTIAVENAEDEESAMEYARETVNIDSCHGFYEAEAKEIVESEEDWEQRKRLADAVADET